MRAALGLAEVEVRLAGPESKTLNASQTEREKQA
jgi:hypothetical protein